METTLRIRPRAYPLPAPAGTGAALSTLRRIPTGRCHGPVPAEGPACCKKAS